MFEFRQTVHFKIYFNGNCFFITYTSRDFSLLYKTNDSTNEKQKNNTLKEKTQGSSGQIFLPFCHNPCV